MELNGTSGLNGELSADSTEATPAEKEAERKRLEARKIVKSNAKRALRDYIAYLSHFDYTPGLPVEITEEFVRKVNQAANGFKIPRPQNHSRVLEMESNSALSNGQLSDALVPHSGAHSNRHRNQNGSRNTDLPSLPSPVIHQISALFSATPPADLPPYPEINTSIATKQQTRCNSIQPGFSSPSGIRTSRVPRSSHVPPAPHRRTPLSPPLPLPDSNLRPRTPTPRPHGRPPRPRLRRLPDLPSSPFPKPRRLDRDRPSRR